MSSAGRKIDADRLCGVLGHELRNPLAGALTGLAAVAAMTDEGDARQAFLSRAQGDLERLRVLLDGWLELARNQRRGDESGGFDLRGTVERAAARTGAFAEIEDGVRWHIEGVKTGALFERALENLHGNAVGAGAGHVRFRVRSAAEAGFVVVDVDDDGRGIPEELRREGRLFDPAVSGDGAPTSGAGLGLAIVHDVVSACGGTIELVDRPGPGTRFALTLPCRIERQPADDAAHSRGTAADAHPGHATFRQA